ncbi:unnamed protein product [Pipistrellus nathusii]|uniref:Uncharacterized protein n=1 Tax=Pipistrellus nathusii TaxID=59473 RepID=A0ABN9ZQT9_PIPNA
MCFAPWGLDAPQAPVKPPRLLAPGSRLLALVCEPLGGFRAEPASCMKPGGGGPRLQGCTHHLLTVMIKDLASSPVLNILFKSTYFLFFTPSFSLVLNNISTQSPVDVLVLCFSYSTWK